MTDSDDIPGSPGERPQASGADRELFESSMREFAESATALAAASIRMQMMMLEQTREMIGAFDAMRAGGEARDEANN